MRQRAQRLGGLLEIISASGLGATVLLNVPVSRRLGHQFLW
jgi:signal transduction histidine kinase